MRITQKNIPWLGAFIESFYNALPMLTGINFLLIMVAAYAGVYGFVAPFFPWFNFVWFFVFVASFLVIMTILTYKFIVPSLNTFRYSQMNKFDSPVLKEIKRLEEQVKGLRKSLATLGVDGQQEFDIKALVINSKKE